MVADGDFGVRVGVPEFWAVSRRISGAWMGARALCGGVGVDVCDLCRNVVAVGGAAVLFSAASGEHGAVHLHAAALDDSDAVE